MNDQPRESRLEIPDNISEKDFIAIKNLMNYLSGKTKTDHPELTSLTKIELEILIHISQGLNWKDIAEVMALSLSAVEYHKQNIERKMGTDSIAELTKIAIRTGLISL